MIAQEISSLHNNTRPPSGSPSLVPHTIPYHIPNKQEFRDSVSLRYGWNIPDTPSFCQCGKENDLDHPLICKKGRYVTMRHDRIRDREANLMSEAGCFNVQTAPALLPIANDTQVRGNKADKARLDVVGAVSYTHLPLPTKA